MSTIIGYIGHLKRANYLLSNMLKNREEEACIDLDLAIPLRHKIELAHNQNEFEAIQYAYEVAAKYEEVYQVSVARLITGEKKMLMSPSGRFLLVLKGEITNIDQFRFEEEQPAEEVLAKWIERKSDGRATKEIFCELLHQLDGQYVLFLLDGESEDELLVAQNQLPLFYGIGEKESIVSTDFQMLPQEMEEIVTLSDETLLHIKGDEYVVQTFQEESIPHYVQERKGDFPSKHLEATEDRMFQYIHEQPSVLCHLVRQFTASDGSAHFAPSLMETLKGAKKLYMIASHSSYYVGLVAKRQFEQLAALPVDVWRTTEFYYEFPFIEDGAVFLFVSPKEESSIGQPLLNRLNEAGYPTIVVTNEKEGHMLEEATHIVSMEIGIERAKTMTKTYTASIALLFMLAAATGEERGMKTRINVPKQFAVCSQAMFQTMQKKHTLNELASLFIRQQHTFIVGSSLDYTVAKKAALMLKELTLVHAEGYASGELRYGPVALVQQGMPIFVLTTETSRDTFVREHGEALLKRGAKVIYFSTKLTQKKNDAFVLPEVHPLLMPIVSIIPFQLMSYYAARTYGVNVDHYVTSSSFDTYQNLL